MKKIFGGLVLLAMLSSVSLAQTKVGIWENLQKLKDGQNVEIVKVNLSTVTGKFKKVSDEEITIEVKKQLIVVKRTDVQRVDKKSSRTLHILAGIGIGGGIGLATFAGSSGDGVYGAMAALPILVGGGAGVGAALPTHSVVYKRP